MTLGVAHVLPASIDKSRDDLADVEGSAQVGADDSVHFLAVVQWLLNGGNSYDGGCCGGGGGGGGLSYYYATTYYGNPTRSN